MLLELRQPTVMSRAKVGCHVERKANDNDWLWQQARPGSGEAHKQAWESTRIGNWKHMQWEAAHGKQWEEMGSDGKQWQAYTMGAT